jgi:hypothetical protein
MAQGALIGAAIPTAGLYYLPLVHSRGGPSMQVFGA